MNELALFAGAGGGILGGHLLGWRTVCAVEIEDYPRRVLLQRQADGILPRFPIWDDVTTFDGKPWRGKVDVISGGFPCQDISVAGLGAGITGSRSGLWKQFARIIGEIGPRYVLVENSPNLKNKGLEVVLEDLWEMGYDAKWGVISAKQAGAPHLRERIWILAHTMQGGRSGWNGGQWSGSEGEKVGGFRGFVVHGRPKDNTGDGSQEGIATVDGIGTQGISESERKKVFGGNVWNSIPEPPVVAHGVAHRVDELAAIGNGQVPAVAKLAWEILNERF